MLPSTVIDLSELFVMKKDNTHLKFENKESSFQKLKFSAYMNFDEKNYNVC